MTTWRPTYRRRFRSHLRLVTLAALLGAACTTSPASLDPDHGAAAVWQDGVLVSAARVRGGDGSLDQMHFGLYAAPSLTHATVANDDIAVYRVTQAPR